MTSTAKGRESGKMGNLSSASGRLKYNRLKRNLENKRGQFTLPRWLRVLEAGQIKWSRMQAVCGFMLRPAWQQVDVMNVVRKMQEYINAKGGWFY